MKRRILISALLAVSLLFTAVGCKKDNALKFEYCELGITLSRDFEPYDSKGAFNTAYYDGNLIVGMTRYSFVDCIEYGFLSTLDPEKFAEVYLEKSGKTNITVEMSGDVPYYTYSLINASGSPYFYLLAFYRTPYAYFVITFITPYEQAEKMHPIILNYANGVYIVDGNW